MTNHNILSAVSNLRSILQRRAFWILFVITGVFWMGGGELAEFIGMRPGQSYIIGVLAGVILMNIADYIVNEVDGGKNE